VVAQKHKGQQAEWFNHDHNYRAAIVETLEIKTAALNTLDLFLEVKGE
jgi:hypothetical protein